MAKLVSSSGWLWAMPAASTAPGDGFSSGAATALARVVTDSLARNVYGAVAEDRIPVGTEVGMGCSARSAANTE